MKGIICSTWETSGDLTSSCDQDSGDEFSTCFVSFNEILKIV